MACPYFPEGNTALPSDDEMRSLHKLAWQLFDTVGDVGPSYFPEGSRPNPDDSKERLLQKINAMMT